MTRAEYRAEVDQRHGHQAKWVLRDARSNWDVFEEVREDLLAWLRLYHRDPMLKVGEKFHNPDGTLTSLAWLAGTNLPQLIDFEESLQKCFLRRGLVSYLKLLLRDVAAAGIEVVPAGQFEFPIAECGLRKAAGEGGAPTLTKPLECGGEAGR